MCCWVIGDKGEGSFDTIIAPQVAIEWVISPVGQQRIVHKDFFAEENNLNAN